MLLPRTGDVLLKTLLGACGSPSRALAQRTKELGARAHNALTSKQRRSRVAFALRVIDRLGVRVLVQAHAAYPERLLHLHDPPAALFLLGDATLLQRESVSIVGARRCTPYGARVTGEIAADLACAGIVVCSGMALGIDSAAHAAALDAAGGTIAVLGCGIDIVYPRSNDGLYRRIAEHGLLMSEFIPGEPPITDHFPRRNRIIAALSRAVLIVEASLKSGSLITVDHALDLGRDVLAVPGAVGFEQSEGTNRLIQDGAALVAGSADVLRELGIGAPRRTGTRLARPAPPLDPPAELLDEQRAVWCALTDLPRHVDDLARTCTLSSSQTLTVLLELELAGYARQLAGMQYVRWF